MKYRRPADKKEHRLAFDEEVNNKCINTLIHDVLNVFSLKFKKYDYQFYVGLFYPYTGTHKLWSR